MYGTVHLSTRISSSILLIPFCHALARQTPANYDAQPARPYQNGLTEGGICPLDYPARLQLSGVETVHLERVLNHKPGDLVTLTV
jgi:hypothetical protein